GRGLQGGDARGGDWLAPHCHGPRRAVFPARRSARDVLEVGFAALKAHHVVAIDRCPILAPALSGAIAAAWDIAEVLASVRKPLDIQVTATDTGLDVDVRGSGSLTAADTTALAHVAERQNLARLTRHGEIVAQRTPPLLGVGRARFCRRRMPGRRSWPSSWQRTARARKRWLTCSAASDHSRCALPSAPRSPRLTATQTRSTPYGGLRQQLRASSRSRRSSGTC